MVRVRERRRTEREVVWNFIFVLVFGVDSEF
jgi:hypothetical protein